MGYWDMFAPQHLQPDGILPDFRACRIRSEKLRAFGRFEEERQLLATVLMKIDRWDADAPQSLRLQDTVSDPPSPAGPASQSHSASTADSGRDERVEGGGSRWSDSLSMLKPAKKSSLRNLGLLFSRNAKRTGHDANRKS